MSRTSTWAWLLFTLLVAALLLAACERPAPPVPATALPAGQTPSPGASPALATPTRIAAGPTTSPAAPTPRTGTPGIANPASEYCVQQGGRVDIRNTPGGQVGYCVFANGSECEEWAYFRGQCLPGSPTVAAGTVTVVAGTATVVGRTATIAGGTATVAARTPTVAAGTATLAARTATVVARTPIPTADLVALVQAKVQPTAFEGIRVLPVSQASSALPLFIVHSYGMRNHNLQPLPMHFVALYTHISAGWHELGWQNLETPDYVYPDAVREVQLDPRRVWIEVPGGAGAHSGTYHLLSFDGRTLEIVFSASSPSPGSADLSDLNGDGVPEVVVNTSDPYVFCYACGVRYISYQVLRWDATQAQLVEVSLQPITSGTQSEPARQLTNRAVDLARGGLWKDALAQITEAVRNSSTLTPAEVAILQWDASLIRLHTDAMQRQLGDTPYPLLAQVFYGDYAAALEIMRVYPPEQIFSPTTPLIVGTVAENWVNETGTRLLDQTNAALRIKPDLAAAYFIRGWGRYLLNRTDPQVRSDVAQAAQLAPNDTLFSRSLAILR